MPTSSETLDSLRAPCLEWVEWLSMIEGWRRGHVGRSFLDGNS